MRVVAGGTNGGPRGGRAAAGRRYDESEGVNVMVEVHDHDKSKMGTPNWTHREEGVRKGGGEWVEGEGEWGELDGEGGSIFFHFG